MSSSEAAAPIKMNTDDNFKRIILSSPVLAEMMEELGYGPWKAAQKDEANARAHELASKYPRTMEEK